MADPPTSPVILLAFANDSDAYLPNLQNERASLFASLQSLDDRGAIQVHKQEETSLEGLFATLNRYANRIAIIHYAGHADGSTLHLEASTGPDPAHAIGLARRFAQLPALQLVFLNGCATHGQVAALLAAGVRAVIATSVPIDDTLATAFAHHFYAALGAEPQPASIESAFETARAFVAARDPNRPVTRQRGAFNAAHPPASGLQWGLYSSDTAESALAWSLPTSAASPVDLAVASIINGTIPLAEARRLAEALGIERSIANPVAPETSRSFTETVTALATARNPDDRRAAASVARGNDTAAYDQLVALAEAGTMAAEGAKTTAALETAAAATRFRQAGALAAPTSIDRAITAYTRAAALDPDDFSTWVALAHLHRRRGALGDAMACADRAHATAQTDQERAAADNERGDLARAMGKLDAARQYFTAGRDLAERMATARPQDASWLANLSISQNKLGEIAMIQEDYTSAHTHFTHSNAIRNQLAALDPADTSRQHALALGHSKLGDVALATKNPAAALDHFTKSLAIRSRLTTLDQTNTAWQRELSISHNKLGELARDRATAMHHFAAAFEIRRNLAALDPANTDWQRDLSVIHNRLGALAGATGDIEEARRHFRASLAIRSRLAASDPANAVWQADLAFTREQLDKLGATPDTP